MSNMTITMDVYDFIDILESRDDTLDEILREQRRLNDQLSLFLQRHAAESLGWQNEESLGQAEDVDAYLRHRRH